MQKILSWIFMFMFAGLAFTVFLYVASIIVPILFFVGFGRFFMDPLQTAQSGKADV